MARDGASCGASEVSRALTMLEVRGVVRMLPGQRYVRTVGEPSGRG